MERAYYASLEESGYDINDIFYWEQRIGMWGAAMHNEMDAAVLSLTGYNSRRLYALALGLPREQRLSKDLLRNLTHR
ncbi:MAG TPA: hypothetical protein VNO69_02985 [Methyloceanibacter sp.]|nr:hypothetical protein [Methyloceanibacter sp.]